MRILSIFGTRPEAVKMAPVIHRLSRQPDIDSLVCVTAQHREMLDQVLDLFDIQPDVDLNLMKSNQSLAGLTAEIFTALDPVLHQISPDWILIQGDTTTVMAAALLAYYRQIRVGHVEAGLRTGNKWQPFPEEINRKIAGVVADLHFAPTATSRGNLLKEGIDDWRIHVTGNTVVDALNEITQRPMPEDIGRFLQEMGVIDGHKHLILVTAHRRENFGKPLEEICLALKTLAEEMKDVQIVWPVHLNPNVQKPVYEKLSDIQNIHLISPAPYLSMVNLIRNARVILTDSGGIQEEATALGIPALVLREMTERPEGVDVGILKLVGTNVQKIIHETKAVIDSYNAGGSFTQFQNPYGDGHAAERIVDLLMKYQNTTTEGLR